MTIEGRLLNSADSNIMSNPVLSANLISWAGKWAGGGRRNGLFSLPDNRQPLEHPMLAKQARIKHSQPLRTIRITIRSCPNVLMEERFRSRRRRCRAPAMSQSAKEIHQSGDTRQDQSCLVAQSSVQIITTDRRSVAAGRSRLMPSLQRLSDKSQALRICRNL